jgi:hypothetical protein
MAFSVAPPTPSLLPRLTLLLAAKLPLPVSRLMQPTGSKLSKCSWMKRWLKNRRMKRAVQRHLVAHGDFHFRGRPVVVPDDLALGIQEEIAEGTYGCAEAARWQTSKPTPTHMRRPGARFATSSGSLPRQGSSLVGSQGNVHALRAERRL